MVFESLNVSLLASETISNSLRGIARAADESGDAAVAAGVEFGAFGEALDAVDDDAMDLAFASRAAASGVDEVGDEALNAAGDLAAYSAASEAASASSIGLASEFGPVRGGLGTIAALAAAAAPALAGLGSAAGGAALGIGGLAGGLGAIAFGGIQREAERMAATSAELEDSGEAMTKIFGNFGKALKDATEPLQTVANTELIFGALEGIVQLVEGFAESVSNVAPTLNELAGVFGSTVMQMAPDLFDEMETTIREMAPLLSDWIGVLEDIPDLIAFLRMEIVQLGPQLGRSLGVAVDFFAALADAGSDILTFILPTLDVLFMGLAALFDIFAALPGPIQQAIVFFGIAAGAMAFYGGVTAFATAVTTTLVGVLATLAGVILSPIGAVAALGAAIVGIISYFGWWDNIIQAITGTWNAFVGAIQWVINTVLSLYDALGVLGPILMPGIFILTHLGDIINWVGGLLGWLGSIVVEVGQAIGEIFGWIAEQIEGIIDFIDEVTNILGLDSPTGGASPSVDLSGLEAGTGGGGGSGGTGARGAPSRAPKKEENNNYDFSGADFSGTDENEVQRRVEEAVAAANRETRAREDAQSFE